jgi:hypothetical protein
MKTRFLCTGVSSKLAQPLIQRNYNGKTKFCVQYDVSEHIIFFLRHNSSQSLSSNRNRKTMQLHECLLLAGVSGAKLSFDRDVWESFLSHVSITPDRESQRYAQGSIMSMLRCIVTEWGSNAQTNFYIPHEYYSGYSYLFQDSEHSAWHSIESRFASPIHSNTRSNIRELRHTFVHAEEHKLHRFHHDVHNVRAKSSMHLPNMMASSTTSPMTFISLKNESFQFALHNPDHSSSIISRSGHVAEFKPAQMTIPYIHPQLNVPVPPLHLPWYYGALCWSFTLAGIVMLSLPQKWTLRGGWRGNVARHEQNQRHWFPYRAFAWVLIVWQVRPFFQLVPSL